ncbi:MAG: ATP-binding protein [Planctomycetes bacterium]|nr:ATP-binding protein [Planctomycetota bacterium]
MKSVFDLCQPREDVAKGRIKDEELAANLGAVISGTSTAKEYTDPKRFFELTHPTRGLRALLENVCRRLGGAGGEKNSVIRLDTQYGGGKTHSLIALYHTLRGMKGVPNAKEFVDPALLPKGKVNIASMDGEDSDPANGTNLERGIVAYTLWGEMAYRLRGREGFELLRKSDEQRVAPGAQTIAQLLGGEPALIMIDEVSVYLRKAAKADPSAASQFSAFLQALIKAVSSTPRTALVCTLAVRDDDKQARDAYREEHRIALEAFNEALSIASRTLMQIDPTEEDETVDVLRRRLFERVDESGAKGNLDAYTKLWERNRDLLPAEALSPETREQFRRGFPLHPETMNVMTEKLSSLQKFQRTRGMLRLLVRTVTHMWQTRPADAYAIHPHHIDLTFEQIRSEFTTKLEQSQFAPALGADIASVPGKDPATAQRIDAQDYPGQPPVTTFVAGTVFLNTMAFGDNAQGLAPDRLRWSVASPAIEPTVIEEARRKFAESSLYLDDRPGAPMRFRVEPNLTQIINRYVMDVDQGDVRDVLDGRIRETFGGKPFELIHFPSTPNEVLDDAGGPYLSVLNHEAHSLKTVEDSLPGHLVSLANTSSTEGEFRKNRNNVVFLVADDRLGKQMREAARRYIALGDLERSPMMRELADYQQQKVKEEYKKSRFHLAEAILHAYRHLYYPSAAGPEAKAQLSHAIIELTASDTPGEGQRGVRQVLREQKKLLEAGDNPDAPGFVRDQTPLKTQGEISTTDLRSEYRRAPRLSILLNNEPLVKCIVQGVQDGVFVYRKGDQVWGKGDPSPTVEISEGAFVHTAAHAEKKGLWPRPAPKPKSEPTLPVAGKRKTGPVPGGPGGQPQPTPEPGEPDLYEEGPLKVALNKLFEKARESKVGHFASVTIRVQTDFETAFKVYAAVGSYNQADVRCRIEAGIRSGDSTLNVEFAGVMKEAHAIKGFIEPQLRKADEKTLDTSFTLEFKAPYATSQSKQKELVDTITKQASGEGWVEARAAKPQEKAE